MPVRSVWSPSFKRLWRVTPLRLITFRISLKTCYLTARRQVVKKVDVDNKRVMLLQHSLLKFTSLNSNCSERNRQMPKNGQEISDENNSLTGQFHRNCLNLAGVSLKPRQIETRLETTPWSWRHWISVWTRMIIQIARLEEQPPSKHRFHLHSWSLRLNVRTVQFKTGFILAAAATVTTTLSGSW